MKVIHARNVNDALIFGMNLLDTEGYTRDSRNGQVTLIDGPVTTVYEKPEERVLFWAARDANPFFHLYESLWMLAGRQDVEVLGRYAKNILNYSDDGKVLHGAYGFRWRSAFDEDQLVTIAAALEKNKDDRRCILQMWDATTDLGVARKDVPCNVVAHFGINRAGALDMTVFNRSNDIIWGAYGANAVHFSVLQEYMARSVGVPVGRYYQVSDNYHGYNSTLSPLMVDFAEELKAVRFGAYLGNFYQVPEGLPVESPKISYMDSQIQGRAFSIHFDSQLERLLHVLDNQSTSSPRVTDPFLLTAYHVLKAHEIYRNVADAPEKYDLAIEWLGSKAEQQNVDWVLVADQWLRRRRDSWTRKLEEATRGNNP